MDRTFDEYARARAYEAETDVVLTIVRGAQGKASGQRVGATLAVARAGKDCAINQPPANPQQRATRGWRIAAVLDGVLCAAACFLAASGVCLGQYGWAACAAVIAVNRGFAVAYDVRK